MTLTTILPSLRRSIPDPFVADRWPECTSLTTTDVVVAGVPMVRLFELCGSPCVHTAAAVIPGSGGRPSPSEQTTVVVTRVVSATFGEGGYHLVIDACMSELDPCWSELRLIGRASTTHTVEFRIDSECRPDRPDVDQRVLLPRDLAPGDLLAMPCRGTAVLRQLRPGGTAPTGGSAAS
ncbi:hypothetical protein KXS11_12705 [Plantibacter flavus]|uniref:hypothetical protein n=1 Tax=Plantibacter flavus TaxID=150123 RepID=UPI003F14C808